MIYQTTRRVVADRAHRESQSVAVVHGAQRHDAQKQQTRQPG